MRKHLLYRLAKHSAYTVPPSTTSRKGDAVGKINALNSAHEIIPKNPTAVKKYYDIFSFFPPTQHLVVESFPANNTGDDSAICGSFVEKISLQYKIELLFGDFFDIMHVTNPQCSCSPFPRWLPSGLWRFSPKASAQPPGEWLFAPLGGILCMDVRRYTLRNFGFPY